MDRDAMMRKIEALRLLLEEWANWQNGYTMKLGYPSRSAVCGGESGLKSFDDMCEAVDTQTCQVVDAVINDLPTIQQSAIFRRYGVAAVFRFPRENYEQVLFDAHERLLEDLPRRGVMVF